MSLTPLLTENLENLLKAIEKKMSTLNCRLAKAPDGSLNIIKQWNHYQYYHRKNAQETKGKYLLKKELPKAAALAQKDYDTRLLKILTSQQKAIKRFLKDYDPDALIHLYENLTAPRKALVKPEFITDEEYVKQWLSQPYKKMGFKADDPEFYTTGGVRVRSKSEVIIAEALERHNIPYRYEYPVYQDGVLMAAPDFNCLNVRLRKDYYWEHLGMLDDEAYADNNVRKLNKYTLNPDFDESRLILTTETKKHPLNTKVIEEKIRRYLL